MNTTARHILLVEPEPVLAEVMAFRLELLGYLVTAVASGEEALSGIAQHMPDLMIAETVLPRLDAAGLIERVTSDERTSGLPIMVLSVDADLSCVQAMYDRGAKDFLVVPFDLEVLEEKVARLLAPANGNEAKPRSVERRSVAAT